MDVATSQTKSPCGIDGAAAFAVGVQTFPASGLRNLITRVVISRAAALRATDPQRADGYSALAVRGSMDAAVYAAVLRSAALTARPENRDRVRPPLAEAA